MKRRDLIIGLAGMFAGASVASDKMTIEPSLGRDRRLNLFNTHTRESLDIVYSKASELDADALAQLNYFLRDHRNGEVYNIDTRTLDIMEQVWFDSGQQGRIEIISGYRSPETNNKLNKRSNGVASKSLHMWGKAIDFRITGQNLAKVRDLAWQQQKGGVGYYPKSQFIHVDCGRTRFWGWRPGN